MEMSNEEKFVNIEFEVSELNILINKGKKLSNEENLSLNDKKRQLTLLTTQLADKKLSDIRLSIVKEQAKYFLKVINECIDDVNGNKLPYDIFVRRMWQSQYSSGPSGFDDGLQSFKLKNKEKCYKILDDFIKIIEDKNSEPKNFIALNSLLKDFHDKIFVYTDFSVA